LFSDFLTQRSVFEPGSVHEDLVVDEVTLGQISLRVLFFLPVATNTYFLEKEKLATPGNLPTKLILFGKNGASIK